jgi:hypothetical protein
MSTDVQTVELEEWAEEDDKFLFIERTSDGWVDHKGDPLPEGSEALFAIQGAKLDREEAERLNCEIFDDASDRAPDGVVVVPRECIPEHSDADHEVSLE